MIDIKECDPQVILHTLSQSGEVQNGPIPPELQMDPSVFSLLYVSPYTDLAPRFEMNCFIKI